MGTRQPGSVSGVPPADPNQIRCRAPWAPVEVR